MTSIFSRLDSLASVASRSSAVAAIEATGVPQLGHELFLRLLRRGFGPARLAELVAHDVECLGERPEHIVPIHPQGDVEIALSHLARKETQLLEGPQKAPPGHRDDEKAKRGHCEDRSASQPERRLPGLFLLLHPSVVNPHAPNVPPSRDKLETDRSRPHGVAIAVDPSAARVHE